MEEKYDLLSFVLKALQAEGALPAQNHMASQLPNFIKSQGV